MIQPKIGITIGDVNGIGLEVILKTLANDALLKQITPVLYGSGKVINFYKNLTHQGQLFLHSVDDGNQTSPGKINVVQCWQEVVEIQPGEVNETGGRYAYLSLDRAVEELKNGKIDALVTAPIHKKAMSLANFPYIGHTEYLGHQFSVSEPLMLLVSDALRIGVVTGHVPLSDVNTLISKERVLNKIKAMHQCLQVDFGIERPLIAVLGLNPHAGDEGVIGNEDETEVRPAIIEGKKQGIMVTGPHPADGFFGSGSYKKVDGVLAMYHDQGLVPFKALSFGEGVNFTAGLPVVRTSPDHGVAFDLAGQGNANPGSFRQAVYLAVDVWRHRKEHAEWHANPLQTRDTFRKGEDEKINY